MIKEVELAVSPEDAENDNQIRRQILNVLRVPAAALTGFRLLKRSVDARSRYPVFRMKFRVFVNEPVQQNTDWLPDYKEAGKKSVIIVGFGPAGMFAALRLLEAGIKPIVLERGSDVRERRKDLRAIQQFDTVNPDSNYCFGEGGAGAYSDGKLYTRSDKRGNLKKVLSVLVGHGATEDILVDAHPHIGSNKLPGVVQSIRETIIQHGGSVQFNTRVSGFILSERKMTGVRTLDGRELLADAVILATGHSARDIFYLLDQSKIRIEAKPFALGLRIEHPQELIDQIQYHCPGKRHPNLPAANYSLVHQVEGRGVYSFCMCPGGIIIPAATAPGEIVVNGMSMSRRDSKYANSGMVVTVDETDWSEFNNHGVFAGLEFQKSVEQQAFSAANQTQKAPAQRLTDFLDGKISSTLPKSSYIPGHTSSDLTQVLPAEVAIRLKEGLEYFSKTVKGYLTEDALLVATESRTSSPIRIPRTPETCEHPEVEGLYPCGEGAGYAGGIVSAAMDGERCAEAFLQKSGLLLK